MPAASLRLQLKGLGIYYLLVSKSEGIDQTMWMWK